MVSPARKRQASSSPVRDRSYKRPLTSSPPEEGELDDSTPGHPSQPPILPTSANLPPKPVLKSKVPFPFKKKNEPTIKQFNVFATPEPPRNTWDDDSRRNRVRSEVKARPSDHWEPDRNRAWRDGGRDYRDRDSRGWSPGRSPERSRSPQRHRLPPSHSPEPSFSPLSRPRERSRSRSRDRGYRDYRRRDDGDRHYRPANEYRYDERDWTRRDDGDRHPRRTETYRPQSPTPLPTTPPPPSGAPPPPPPASELVQPRPPSKTPPPAPPPDLRLVNNHPPLSFPAKRPPLTGLPQKPTFKAQAPASLPPAPPQPEITEKPLETKPNPPVSKPPKIRVVRRREVSKRTPKQDMEAYGRTFVGCGSQTDYDVTTKLGEGTFGEVHKAVQKSTGVTVALKRILMHHEKEGMPVTALREIKILKALKHPCIVDILDMFVVQSSEKDPLSVYMVFPYMDHDLAGLLENERVKLQPSQIKLYMKQLLEGTEYMHRNHILHRDMKAANLLISNSGNLRIADFGLARSFDVNITKGGSNKKYTNCVVTRWYRPPELLLGARQYGGEVDIWGIGCVLGEMFTRRPILPGTSDLDQLEKIWYLCGTPTQHSWPNFDALPGCDGIKRFNNTYTRRVKMTYESVGPETADLLDKLLVCNPKERITATQALEHDYFWTDPLPADPKSLPSYEASHEFDKRGHRSHHPMPGGAPPAPPPGGLNKPLDGQHRPILPPPAGHPERRRGGPHPHNPYGGPPPGPFNCPLPPYRSNQPPNMNNMNPGPGGFRPGPPPLNMIQQQQQQHQQQQQQQPPPYGHGPPGGWQRPAPGPFGGMPGHQYPGPPHPSMRLPPNLPARPPAPMGGAPYQRGAPHPPGRGRPPNGPGYGGGRPGAGGGAGDRGDNRSGGGGDNVSLSYT